MLIKDALNITTKSKLIQFANDLKHQALWKNATHSDLLRKQTKGTIYADEVIKIRLMSKRQLSKYLRNINKDKAVITARKIKDPYLYRQFDTNVLNKIELYSYAFNRMLTLK